MMFIKTIDEKIKNDVFCKSRNVYKNTLPWHCILLALRSYFVHKLSLRKIQKEIKLQFPQYKTTSHAAIIKWTNKLSYLLSLAYINKNIVLTGKWFVWLTNDTVIKINDSKYYLIVVIDHNSGCILSWFLSPTRKEQHF